MASRRFEMRIDEGLWDRLEDARGDVSAARFVTRALERDLADRVEVEPSRTSWTSDEESSPEVEPPPGHVASARHCERCGRGISSPSLLRHPSCGGKVVPEPV